MRILTISTDTPGELAKGHRKHRLGATMLSDRELEVTDRFGLRNKGIHSGPPPPIAAKALPVPTSLLVDANGRVLWMDQLPFIRPQPTVRPIRSELCEDVAGGMGGTRAVG